MALDPALLEILRCPDEHHAVLDYDEVAQTLTCVDCHRAYPVRDGIPVLLLDEGQRPVPPGEDVR
ncbi:MAG: Trm112 family protein [Dactylosporangium sp.]|nr:Trm112 family protein [Dactylosporangium sp.]NNJ63408.1 Trm112 family protein [Dactylosporangium sp.]